jgi:hypothetical protein
MGVRMTSCARRHAPLSVGLLQLAVAGNHTLAKVAKVTIPSATCIVLQARAAGYSDADFSAVMDAVASRK